MRQCYAEGLKAEHSYYDGWHSMRLCPFAVEAIAYLIHRSIDEERIGSLGLSLGVDIAILVAAQKPKIPAMVADSYFA